MPEIVRRAQQIYVRDVPNLQRKTCPGVRGATNWYSTAFDPHTRLFYLMTAEDCGIYRKSGNLMRYAWLFPAAAVYLLIFMSYALRLCHTGRYAWRGSVFATARRDEPL